MKMYTLTPLSGATGQQLVLGFSDAIAIARNIAARERCEVRVRNEADCHTWRVAFRVVNGRSGARTTVQVTR